MKTIHSTLETMLTGWTIEAEPCLDRPQGTSWGKGALHFSVTLKANGAERRGYYSVGSAIPILSAQIAAAGPLEEWQEFTGRCLEHGSLKETRLRPSKVSVLALDGWDDYDHRMLRTQLRRAYRPPLVDVVSALFMDAAYIEEGTTFRSWVEETDATTMSPADAHDCYEACRDAWRFLSDAAGSDYETMLDLAGEE